MCGPTGLCAEVFDEAMRGVEAKNAPYRHASGNVGWQDLALILGPALLPQGTRVPRYFKSLERAWLSVQCRSGGTF